jgi:predicted Zn-dependent protease
VRSRTSDAPATLAYARAARAAKQSDLAAAQFDRVLALEPENAAAAREYADLLMERRNPRKAEGLYRSAHAAGIRDEGLLLGFAGALTANDKPSEAAPLLEQVYARHPTERLAFDLARLHRKLGNNARALELLADIQR